MLIEEKILSQYHSKLNYSVTQQALDEAIASIEANNNNFSGNIKKYFNQHNIDYSTFKQHINAEIIKNTIINSLSQFIVLSDDELDRALIENDKDFDIEAWIFTAKRQNKSQIESLKQNLSHCGEVSTTLYCNNIKTEQINQNLLQLKPTLLQSIVLDTKVGKASSIYMKDNIFRFIFICKKEAIISQDKKKQIELLLFEKKLLKKFDALLTHLKMESDINILIPSL